MTQILNEVKRSQSLAKSKKGDKYIWWNRLLGDNRHERRLHQKVSRSVANYNKLNMNKLFKENILDVNIEVKGETDTYLVRVSFLGFLDNFRSITDGDDTNLKLKDITRALTMSFNNEDVYFRCNCADFCLHPDTKIKLLNNEHYTVAELFDKFNAGEELWVYSTDAAGDFKPGRVLDVWISGYTDEMIEVTLDNGEKIITTPDHPYMLRDGSYLEAEKLAVGQSLMPLYFKLDKKGYESVKRNSKAYPTAYYSVYKIVAAECLQDEQVEARERSGEDQVAIHHSDFKKLNNYPSNLKLMGVQEHWKYHCTHVYESGNFEKWKEGSRKYWATQEARDKQAAVMSQVMADYYACETEEQRKARRAKLYTDEWKQHISESTKEAWANYTQEEYEARCEINRTNIAACKEKRAEGVRRAWREATEEEHSQRCQRDSEGVKRAWADRENNPWLSSEKYRAARKNAFQYERTPETKRQMLLTKIGKVIQRILDAGEVPSPETYDIFRLSGKARYPRFTKAFATWDEVSEYYALNHKVVAINRIKYDEKIPVYDISVEKYNNFYVDAGVILHNCYRQAYWCTRNGTIVGTPETRPSNKTNPNDTKGGMCKHIAMTMSNNSWIQKVASVIRNYILYMQKHMPDLYYKVIYPALYNKEYTEPLQMDINDITGDERTLGSDEDELDTANKWAKTKSQFKAGNEYRYKPTGEVSGQKSFNFDSEVSD